MAQLTRYEMETLVNYNAGEDRATVYTADKAVMRRMDKLVSEFPEQYKLLEQTDYAKTYSMPKSYVSYRKPRKLTDEQRELKRLSMRNINNHDK